MPLILSDPDNRKFVEYDYNNNEKKFETEVKKHFSEIFGEEVRYLDAKPRIVAISRSFSVSGVPDGYALDVSGRSAPKFWLVEYELQTHDVFKHITEQVFRFEELLDKYRDRIFDALRTYLKTDKERMMLYDALWKGQSNVVIIINKATSSLQGVMRRRFPDVRLVEFRTFIEEGKGIDSFHLHQFSILETLGPSIEKGRYTHFFSKVNEQLKSKLSGGLENYKSQMSPKTNYFKVWYNYRPNHFEVRVMRGKLIEVALHLEGKREKSLEMLNRVRKRRTSIKEIIPNLKFDGDWGKTVHWCRVYEEVPFSDMREIRTAEDKLVSKVTDLMVRYITVLKKELPGI